MSKKLGLALCWDSDDNKPTVIKYRKSDSTIIESQEVKIETIAKMISFYMDKNNTKELTIDEIKITK